MRNDPTDLRAQERDRKAAEENRKLQRDQDGQDFKWLMSDVRGRRFVWRLLETTGVYRNSFDGSSRTYFNEGMRNVGLMLMADIHEFSPETYAVMLKEMKEHGRKHADRRAAG